MSGCYPYSRDFGWSANAGGGFLASPFVFLGFVSGFRLAGLYDVVGDFQRFALSATFADFIPVRCAASIVVVPSGFVHIERHIVINDRLRLL